MADCRIDIKIKKDLQGNNVIDENGKILNEPLFNKVNEIYTKHANSKYGINSFGKTLLNNNNGNVNSNELFSQVTSFSIQQYKDSRYVGPELEDIRAKIKGLVSNKADTYFNNVDRPVEKDFNKSNRVILFNNTEDSTEDASEVLYNILDSKDNLSNNTKELVKKISPLLENTKAKVRVIEDNSLKFFNSKMEYDSSNNTIHIPKSTLKNLGNDEVITSFLHEVVHSVTVHALNDPSNVSEEMFSSFMRDMFSKYKQFAEDEGFEHEGFDSVEEFVSELMTNETFQNKIKSLEGKNKNYWNKFVDYIRSLIGLKKTSDYHKMIDSITDISNQIQTKEEYKDFGIFQKKKREFEFYDLSDHVKKIDFAIDKILDNLDDNLRVYDRLLKKAEKTYKDNKKDKKKLENLKGYKEKLSKLKDNIEKLDDANRIRGLFNYVEYASSQLNNLKERIDELDPNEENFDRTLNMYQNYVSSYTMINSLQDYISDLILENKNENFVNEEELNNLSYLIQNAKSVYSDIDSKFKSYAKKIFLKKIDDSRYFPEIRGNIKTELEIEYNNKVRNKQLPKIKNKKKRKKIKRDWVNEQLKLRRDEIEQKVHEEAKKLVNNAMMDISSSTYGLMADDDINNKLIQISKNMLESLNIELIDKSRETEFMLHDMFKKLVKAKGTTNHKKLYENFFEKNAEGYYMLRGEYSVKFYDKYYELKNKVENKLEEIAEKEDDGYESKEYKKYKRNNEFLKWKKNNTKKNSETGEIIPLDKWKNKELTGIEKEVLDMARETFETSYEKSYHISPLPRDVAGARYYWLPSVTKSRMERILNNESVDILKDGFRDIKNIRPDDIGYATEKFDINNNPVNDVRLHFRGTIDNPNEQSLDLFTLLSLEAKNTASFHAKNEMENNMQWLLEIAKNKDYYRKKGGMPVLSASSRRNELEVKNGEDSYVYKKLKGIMETNIYDIFKHDMGSISGFDANKVIDTLNSWTAQLGMSMNIVSATANVTNGKAQLWLESIGGHHISRKSLRKAEAKYWGDMPNIIKDITNPVKKSFTHQIINMFDIQGSTHLYQNQEFIKSNLMKTSFNTQTLTSPHLAGEHYLQSTLAMSLLSDIKVMNNNHEFIDKNGKVVKEKENAASLLDMINKDNKGLLRINNKVKYTTHTPNIKLEEGGREFINRYLKKKMRDTMGNYDPKNMPELQKNGWGRMVMLYRRYLVPMFMARFRGTKYLHKDTSDLKPYQKFYSEALQEYEYGTYTTVARYIFKAGQKLIKEKEKEALGLQWDKMSDFEKSQFRKGVSDLIIGFVLLPLLTTVAVGLAGDDDDKYSFTWFAVLQSRRLQSELQSFLDLSEQWRIFRTPFASMRILENAGSLLGRLATFSFDERYEGGIYDGELKIARDIQDLIPIISTWNSSFESKYNFLEGMSH